MFIKSVIVISFGLTSLFGSLNILDPRLETKQIQKIETHKQVVKTLEDVLPAVTPYDVEQWYKVAQCETAGDWAMKGPRFSGGLGIRNDVWIAYGGGEFAPTAGYATIREQIIIAKRINSNGYVPDQDGICKGW